MDNHRSNGTDDTDKERSDMANYLIFTDSTGDLTPALIEQAGLQVLPMTFTLDGATYRNYPDGREMPLSDFYNKLRNGSISTTSQVTLADFEDAFTPVLEQGQDILYLAFSSGLSGTYQASNLASQELMEKFPGRRVLTVDSLQASMGEGLFSYLVANYAKGGASLDETADYARKLAPTVCAWFTVDDLMFLKRGGRCSGAAAVAGTLLGIKPVLHVDDEGHLIPMEKVRGRRASLDALVKHYQATALDVTGGTVFLSHGDCKADCDYVADKLRALGVKDLHIGDIGPVIGAHSGPGTVALFWVGSKR